jgi:hypothetical protein
MLREIVPMASSEDINAALVASQWYLHTAAQQLLGMFLYDQCYKKPQVHIPLSIITFILMTTQIYIL